MPIVIYALIDPRSDELRYVGQTCRPLRKRLVSHVRAAHNKQTAHVVVWLRGLLLDGLKPEAIELETFEDRAEADAAEVFWIQYARSIGCKLTNRALGGRVRSGWSHSLETREKWRRERSGVNAPWYGKKRSPEVMAALAAGMKAACIARGSHPQKGRVKSPEEIAKIKAGVARNPPKHSEERRAKLADRSRKMWEDPEFRARHKAAISGSNNVNYGKRPPDHVLQAAREGTALKLKGAPKTAEHRKHMSDAQKERYRRLRAKESADPKAAE